MGKYFYPAISDKIYEKLGEKYFLIMYPFLLYVLIAGKYLYIFGFDVLVHIALFLLRHKINFLDFYYKRIIIIFWTITLLLSTICFTLFKQVNYLYMTKAYMECSVLESKEYSLVYRNRGYETYMMKNHENVEDDFKVIENLIGKIDSYEIDEDNKYKVILKNNHEIDVKFNNYDYFTFFSLDIDLVK